MALVSHKPTISIDFDGVILNRSSNYAFDATKINGEIAVDGAAKNAVTWLTELVASDEFVINIYDQVRSPARGGITAMKDYLEANGITLAILNKIEFPQSYPTTDIYYGNRVYRFEGVAYPSAATIKTQIPPWNA